jgi:MFS family permease
MARGFALTYLVLILDNVTDLKISEIGIIISISTFIGGVASMLFGPIIDGVNKNILIFLLSIISAISYLLLAMVNSFSFILLLLTIIVFSYQSINTIINAIIANNFSQDERILIFSVRYVLINLAFGASPLLAAYLISVDAKYTFFSASIAMMVAMLAFWFQKIDIDDASKVPSLRHYLGELKYLFSDSRLLCFVLGSFFSSITLRQFPSYISIYLLNINTIETSIALIINSIIITNTVMIVVFQVHITKITGLIGDQRKLFCGLVILVLSLIVFLNSNNQIYWVVGMVLFSISEMLIVPTEFALVERLAPQERKGAYLAAQNLANLGGAFSPLIAVTALLYLPAEGIFYSLVFCLIVAAAFYMMGLRNNRGYMPKSW